VVGRRTAEVLLRLQALLAPVGLPRYATDGWGTSARHGDPEHHTVSTEHMQRIERKHLTWRTRITRLVRRTSCCSKTERMHDRVMGLFITRDEFGLSL
jgi:insertion element IS1 protein InsB